MPEILNPQTLLCAAVLLPGCAFALMALVWLAGIHLSERTTARVALLTYGLTVLCVLGVGAGMWQAGTTPLEVPGGNLYAVGDWQLPLSLFADWLSLPLLALAAVLLSLIVHFSQRYMHRDPNFNRFFLLLHLFAFGMLLLVAAKSFDLMIAGWELAGIASVLLIALFHESREAVESSIRVFATFRLCDIGLIAGVFALHAWPQESIAIALLFLFAAMGMSAQAPFSGWLARAMEGPTPVSAIFFGGISVHAGAYLLLRAQPIFEASVIATGATIAIGLWSALHGTMVARVCADARTSLAYASVSQLGLIFVEIGLGWTWLALAHIMGHAVVRTYQLLRAPSLLHEHQQVYAASGGHRPKTGAVYESLLSPGMRAWLYRLALDYGHHDTILDRFFIGWIRRAVARVNAIERRVHG